MWSPETGFVARLSRIRATADDLARARDLAAGSPDWDRVLALAAHHGVAALIDANLTRAEIAGIPPAFRARLRRHRLESARADLARWACWLELGAAFAQEGIRAMTLRGFHAVLSIYGEVGLRPVGDLDFLVHRGDVERALALLERRGYRPWREWRSALENVGLAHIMRSTNELGLVSARDIVVDLHWGADPAGPSTADLMADARTLRVDGGEAVVASPTDAMVLLLLHGNRSAWSRLRWLVDVAEGIEAMSDAEYAAVARRLDALGMRSALAGARQLIEDLWGRVPTPMAGADPAPSVRRTVRYAAAAIERGRSWDNMFDLWRPVRQLVDRVGRGQSLAAAAASALRPIYLDWAAVRLPASLRAGYWALRPVRIVAQALRHRPGAPGAAPAVPAGPPDAAALRRERFQNVRDERPDTPVTVVTALYDSGPDSLLGGRGRGLRHYLPSLINIANLGVAIVVFCPAREAASVEDEIAVHFRRYRVIPFELEEFEHFDAFVAWKETYRRNLVINDRNEVLCFLKSYWLQRAIALRPFGHDVLFWIDAGLTHHGLFPERVGGVELMVNRSEDHYYPRNSANIFTPALGAALVAAVSPGKVYFCALAGHTPSPAPSAELVAATFGVPVDTVRVTDHLVGGIFGGHAADLRTVHAMFAQLLGASIAARQRTLEEPLFSALHAVRPDLFAVQRFDTWYFHGPGEPTGRLATEANSYYKIFTSLAARHAAARRAHPPGPRPLKRIRVYLGPRLGDDWFATFARTFCRDFVECEYDVEYATPTDYDHRLRSQVYTIGGRRCAVHPYVVAFEAVTSGRLRLLVTHDHPINVFTKWNFDPARVDRIHTGQYNPARLEQEIRAAARNADAHGAEMMRRSLQPWIYRPLHWETVAQVRAEPQPPRAPDLYFRGLLSPAREALRHLATYATPDDRLDIGWWGDGQQGAQPPRDYLRGLRTHGVALSFAGAADLSHRDFEGFALGVPVLRPVIASTLAHPLTAGVHYIGVPFEPVGDTPDGPPADYPKDPRQLARDIVETYRRIRDDRNLLARVAANASDYYDRYCAYPRSGAFTMATLELDSL
ncbi:MAG TPA: nucleotidyltransferase family protein [Gemmatimonadaceae bacterium]|nr:nucleotidyltransferase family protein [Gemmatimonadaceae bacterium]